MILVDSTLINVLSTPSLVKLEFSSKIPSSKLPQISTSADAYDLLKGIWDRVGGIDYFESFVILLLNRANKVIGWHLVSKGGVNGTVADPRIIFQAAILTNASAIILAHNHPSGNLRPSEPDKALTKKLKEGGKVLDIPVLDHLIVTSEDFFSFADEGIL